MNIFSTVLEKHGCSLCKSSFYDCLKSANITPVFKKDEPKYKENNRPVSLLPLLSKVFKRLIYD